MVIKILCTSGSVINLTCQTNPGGGLITGGYDCDIKFANSTSEDDEIMVITDGQRADFRYTDVRGLSSTNASLSCVPNALLQLFPNVNLMHLNYVGLERIGVRSFEICSQLKSVQLNGNLLAEIPSLVFQNCKNLSKLALMKNQIAVLGDEAFVGLEELKTLELRANELTMIGKEVLNPLTSVVEIDFRENEIRFIHPEAFVSLTNLITLRLSKNDLTSIDPVAFKNLNSLLYLYLAGNQIKSLNSMMFQGLQVLRDLDLSGNQITEVPADCLSPLENLDSLYLGSNHISSISSRAFESLSNLRTLNLNDNDILYLCAKVFEPIRNLTWLSVKNNSLRQIDLEVFKKLSSLINLELSSNPLGNFLRAETFENFESLTELEIADIGIDEFPPRSLNLTRLKKIDMSNNKIRRLNSNSFGKMLNLEQIFINDNEIDEIERDFFKSFPKLYLILARNNLCIEEDFPFTNNIEITLNFSECFDNWDDPRTTIRIETTTGASTKIASIAFVLCCRVITFML